jgi:SHS2 domain-containing protein
VVTDPASVADSQSVPSACAADDDEQLLVDWRNAIVYEMAVRRMLFGRFEVELADRRAGQVIAGEQESQSSSRR